MRKAILFFVCILCFAGTQASIRGLNPDYAAQYSGDGGVFKCFDGSKVVPFSRVNDDYCDCPDGSDEPGSSACAKGRFYCRNKGHEAKLLSASFVDDGVCDCCDGTDELRGCANTCLEKSAGRLIELKQKVASYGDMLAKKANYVEQAAARRKEWGARSHTIDAEIRAKLDVVEAARAEKLRAEEQNTARVEVEKAARSAEEERRRLVREERLAEEERMKQVAAAAADLAGGNEQDTPSEGEVGGHVEETAEERGRRIASQWTTDPDAAASQAEGLGESEQHEEFDEGEQDEDEQPEELEDEEPLPYVQAPAHQLKMDSEWEDFMKFVDLLVGYTRRWMDWFKMVFREGIARDVKERRKAALERRHGSGPAAYRHGSQRNYRVQQMQADEQEQMLRQQQQQAPAPAEVSAELREATQILTDVETELATLHKDKSDMEKYQAHSFDYGPDNIFFPYAGRCFVDNGNRWAFEVCFFDKASQMEANSHNNKVNLGTWRGFSEGYTTALFDGGDACANAPQRSMRVYLQCGAEEILHSGSEPSTCVYQSAFVTPLACTHQEHQSIMTELQQLLSLQAEVQAEIAAAEKDEL
ncbi:hypothetical protein CEUSTIGMA_g13310.t1 [Chlamydomonas eustigma]|uniref:Glucosidase 2 subunit beta n=1 Tax=Chlamydomonas eustigma TaxID=1157962 RepID=A0A250XS61_9CHLO|nr:hypothetical protein CEUSTIGMA_g13310.t1 [Chlamydomonas eustigma]|eukprot:GAX85894.1 hypothetical protein CEUSTIGMA_g13310.t1 [Chlamydomonas eustigma]